MAIARINGSMIAWARRRAGASIDALATKSISPQEIAAWEKGDDFPNETEAQKLADRLHIGYPMLFMTVVPPDEKINVPDLRTVSGIPVSNPSLDFLKVLDDTAARQEWYRSERIDDDKSPLKFVGKFSLKTSTQIVAEDMRSVLSLDAHTRNDCKDFEAFLKVLVARAERSGVLVMRSSVVGHDPTRTLKVSEFRGFALIDAFAPVIFINDQDAKAAQIFTLAHELAHIWIGEGGVSDRKPDDRKNSKNIIELFCDQVAAELLVPAKEFAPYWHKQQSIDQNVRSASLHFRVSSLVVLRRAKDANLIPLGIYYSKVEEQYDAYRRREKEKLEQQKKRERKGGNFWASFDLRNSLTFNNAVVASLEAQRTTYTEAASLFGVGLKATVNYLKRVGANH